MTNTEDYIYFCEAVRQGNYRKTSQLWLTYMDHVWLDSLGQNKQLCGICPFSVLDGRLVLFFWWA